MGATKRSQRRPSSGDNHPGGNSGRPEPKPWGASAPYGGGNSRATQPHGQSRQRRRVSAWFDRRWGHVGLDLEDLDYIIGMQAAGPRAERQQRQRRESRDSGGASGSSSWEDEGGRKWTEEGGQGNARRTYSRAFREEERPWFEAWQAAGNGNATSAWWHRFQSSEAADEGRQQPSPGHSRHKASWDSGMGGGRSSSSHSGGAPASSRSLALIAHLGVLGLSPDAVLDRVALKSAFHCIARKARRGRGVSGRSCIGAHAYQSVQLPSVVSVWPLVMVQGRVRG